MPLTQVRMKNRRSTALFVKNKNMLMKEPSATFDGDDGDDGDVRFAHHRFNNQKRRANTKHFDISKWISAFAGMTALVEIRH